MIKEGLLTFVLVWCISANRCKQKDCFLWKNMHQIISRNWENSNSRLQSPLFFFYWNRDFSHCVNPIQRELNSLVLSALFQSGGRLCPPDYYLAPRIFRPSAGSAVLDRKKFSVPSTQHIWFFFWKTFRWKILSIHTGHTFANGWY